MGPTYVFIALCALAQSQPPPDTQAQTPAESPSASERAARAAERAAAAAERAARALEQLAARDAEPAASPDPLEPQGTDAAGPAEPAWTGNVGLNLVALSGNSETLTFTATGAAERRTENWVVGVKVAGAYGQSRVDPGTEPSVVALQAQGQVRGDRRLSNVAAGYVLGGLETDHVKSVEYRYLGEGGAALRWIEQKKGDRVILMLRTDLALRYANESRFQYFPTPADLPDLALVAPKLGLGFRYALNENVSVVEEAEVLTNIMGASRVLVSSLTRLSARLTGSFSLSVGFQVNHDSLPAEGRVPTDTILSTGVELAL